jgi:hypothetical protein
MGSKMQRALKEALEIGERPLIELTLVLVNV